MCGLAGAWVQRPERGGPGRGEFQSALSCLVHRGPDDHGVWEEAGEGVLLGHRRLSILDLSPLGHQPMVSDGGPTAIVFNGEIYNFPELRRELEAAGIGFRSRSDTEVVLRGYEHWGEGVLDRLVGMFSIALWDGRRRELFLARDRAGEKPLYYAETPWGFTFASEIGALASMPGVGRTVDAQAVASFLTYQYVPAPQSIYRGVRKLPPGHAMRVSRQGSRVWRYWDPVAVALEPRLEMGEEEATARTEALLREAVRGQMLADVPLGAFLSGGIDSTVVVSLMAELSSSRVRTFTIGFEAERYNEARHAEAVARHIGTDHVAEYLTERDSLDLIPLLPRMYGEPFADSSALPTHLVSCVARKHVTVSLSGDGGDEAFGGYTRYAWLERFAAPFGMVPAGAARLVGAALVRAPGSIGRAAPLLGRSPREFYRGLLSLFSAREVAEMTGTSPALAEFDRAWEAGAALPLRRRAMLADLLTYLPEAILVKVDRAAMATSLETRAPFLDHRVLELALRLPTPMVNEKHVLRNIAYSRVPRALLERPKQGFGVPLAEWLRTDLRPLLTDVVTPARMASVGVQMAGAVQRTLREHLAGKRDHSARLWALLMLGMWAEEHGAC